MFKKFLFLFAVMFISANLMAQWTYLTNSGVTGILRSVSIVDANVAFISGDSGIVLKTTNGGLNWTNIAALPIPATMGCDVVRAIDANTVIVAGTPSASFVYKTTNSGTTWTQVFSETGGYVDDIRFKDANNGFMYGDPVGGRWSLWKTTNGGTTWDSTGLYLAQVAGEAGWDNDMCVQGNNIWFGASANSHVYRSTDFGASWISSTTTGIASTTCVTFSGNIGFVTGGGVTLKSTDAGITWSAFTNPGTSLDIHLQSLGTRFWIAQTNMYYSTNSGSTFPLSYTYAQTTGPMWGIAANHTGTQLTVFVTGYAGGIWKYTETVEPEPTTPLWVAQTSPLTGVSLNCVSAVNANVCWIGANTGGILLTTDAGTTWTNKANATVGANDVYAICGLSATTCLVSTSPAATFVFRTTDGGTTWAQVFTQVSGFIDDIKFKDANNGFIYGDPVSNRWSLWKTSDAGLTWDSAGLYLSGVGEAGWNNAMYIEGNYIWFGTNNTKVYKSNNFGATGSWMSGVTTGTANSYSVAFNGGTGFAGTTAAAKSVDGGGTYTTVTVPGTGNLYAFNTVKYTNRFWYNRSNIIYASTDNGTTFAEQYTGTVGATFQAMHIILSGSILRGWSVSNTGLIAMFDQQFVATNVTPISNVTPETFSLSQNYPNPFNPTTKISFALPKSGFVSLKVYDILGKEVATLVNSNMSVGSYSFEFNASNLTSGIYFYRLESNGFIDTKKMMLIK